MVNNCTSGRSWNSCEKVGVPADRDDYAYLLRKHAEVYPTGEARVGYSSSTLDWIVDALQVQALHVVRSSVYVVRIVFVNTFALFWLYTLVSCYIMFCEVNVVYCITQP